jgi:hypothetical protein
MLDQEGRRLKHVTDMALKSMECGTHCRISSVRTEIRQLSETYNI